MNIFDAVIAIALLVAVVTGFRAGLLRSATAILGYLVAMPIAVWATSLLSPQLNATGTPSSPWTQSPILFFGCFLLAGIVLGRVFRLAVDEIVGSDIGLADRLAGSVLGAIRVFLLAVTLVLIFDRLIPIDRQPAFLVGSQLRPALSAAGQEGFKSLPPDIAAYIDGLKQAYRI